MSRRSLPSSAVRCLVCIQARVPVFLWGAPGVGKSICLEEIAPALEEPIWTVILSIRSGKVALNTHVDVDAVADGSFSTNVINGNAAAGAAETGAIVINFAVIKAVSA